MARAKDERQRLERRRKIRSTRLCECGCGEYTYVAMVTDRAKGWVKGQGKRFLQGHHAGGVPLLTPVSPVKWRENAITGCWIWLRGTTENGYGVLAVDGRKRVKAHRWVYEQEVGPIPEGMALHHKCENPRCVNPAHLEPITPSEHQRQHIRERNAA